MDRCFPSGPRLVALAVAALLAACAALPPPDAERVAQLATERVGRAPPATDDPAASRVDALLAAPLDADGAVELAFLQHRGLRARLAALAVAEAERAQAGRLRNPGFGFARLAGGGAVEIERSLMVDLLGLLSRPLAVQAAGRRFERAQLQAAADAVDAAFAARRAFFDAVAARQLLHYRRQVVEAADAAGELARRMREAGNAPALAQWREQAFAAEAAAQLARAEAGAVAARERLARALGLDAARLRALQLPERLPPLPAAPPPAGDAERRALDQRLDVQIARADTEAQAAALGLVRATRFVNVLELGPRSHSQSGEDGARGFGLRLELPLFDSGDARLARAEALHRQALHRVAALAVDAQSQVRQAHAGLVSAHAQARRHRDELVPLRQRIAEDNLRRYNAMQIGVFELLADARDQVAAVAAAVAAERDYWLADNRLQAAVVGGVATQEDFR